MTTGTLDLSNLQAAAFDFDGTLAETRINFARMRSCIIEHLQRWDVWEDGMDDGRYVLDIIDMGADALGDAPERVAEFRAEADLILEQVELETCATAEPFPGVPEALDDLRSHGLKVAIVTRNCRAGVQSVLSRHHLHYDVLLTRDDVHLVKPDPFHLAEAVRLMDVDPRRTVMVGDHISDIQGADGLGVITIGVLTQKTTTEQFQEVGADAVLPDVPAVVKAIIEARGCASV